MAKNEIDIIKKGHQKDFYDSSREDELLKCASDPIYFIQKYIRVQHPKKGRIPLELYPFQIKMIKNFHQYKDNILMASRQTGKTTCAAAFILWKTMFEPDVTVLITANKMNQAMEIMDRIRFSYENLEDFNWLRAGAMEYNKGTIRFDNGSKIVARATTPDAGRGLSITLLYIDEMSFIKPTIAKDFFTAIQPTLSTGGSCIITSTPNNDEDEFARIWFEALDTIDDYGNDREDGLGKNGFKAFLSTWRDHPDRDEKWEKEFRAKLGNDRFLREFECEFISFDETLVNAATLASLKGRDELFKINGEIRWYSEPKANHAYVVSLDPSTGTGGDYSAIQVLELPSMVQVAEWRHNKTSIKGQITVLMDILNYIFYTLVESDEQVSEPELFWSVENNGLGEAALLVISDTGEEEFPGMFVHEPKKSGGARRRKGLYTSNKSKITAALKLKSLLETRKITLNSKAIIKELKNYIKSGAGFAAKTGETDDLVSALLMCLRISLAIADWDENYGDSLKEAIGSDDDDNFSEPLPYSF
jgi:Terminase large subunit, T4likevirus-type, N-terminal/Terminase RNaseH-like domain